MAKMIHCKTCGKEIAKDAKTCPYCGAKNKKGHGFLKFLLFLIIAGGAWSYFTGGTETLQRLSSIVPENSSFSKILSGTLNKNHSGNPTSSKAAGNSGADVSADGVTPELKEFLDSYESFVNEYCDFMENYDSRDVSDLAEYTELLQKELDFAKKVEAYDQDKMSDADLKYYLAVTARVEKRLLDVSLKK